MSELRVGMRVKVVAPDPNDGGNAYVGMTGVVRGRWTFENNYGYVWSVDLDDISEVPFTSQELAPLVEHETTVIEGVVSIVDGQAYIDVDEENPTVEDMYGRFVGKRVRVTIEHLDEGSAS